MGELSETKNVISVVSPVYGCCECLVELCDRLRNTLSQIADAYEIILVNDASKDDSWQIIRELSSQDKRIKGINFSRNFGQHYAISAGLDVADGDWTVVMDCDLQNRPEDIPRLYEKALEGYDIVSASHEAHKSKRFTSKLYYRVHKALSKEEAFPASFLILSKRVVLTLRRFREKHRLILKLLQYVGFSRAVVPVESAPRVKGSSSYTFMMRAKLGIFGIVSSTTRLLRAGIVFGVLTSATSFLFGIYILISKLMIEDYAAGWSSLIVSIYFVGGIIMILLGIIGVYLEVMFDEVKGRPLYIVKGMTNIEE